ncbi:Ig-like domain-containing protein [Hungatella effluvii]|uniref:Ig-like domain-containing protein n=1 Tax=Hungatella effluvii TaxID=1096246 RepID=UPI0022E94CE1|nr:Ig-like domain-containing protein [Hungatella effluvii]
MTAVSLADHNLKAACTVEITEKVPAKVTLNVSSVNLYQGDTYKLQASTESDEALTVRFSSDNPSVAEVSADGTILAMRPGTAVITARAGEGFATCEVTVLQSDEDDGNGDYTDTSFRKTTGRPRADIAADTVIGLWIQDGTGWWLMKEDGSYPASSWERVNGNWYYFKEDGYLATGWIYDPEYQSWFYLNPDGTMAVGWQTIDGKQYYFNPVSDGTKGRLCADTNASVTDKVGDAV